uniref:Uncharacterized protein n=1 Tax=Rhipicephalus zambeziensis TaxID=60191 RepID=A0A224Y6W0_9ACAR
MNINGGVFQFAVLKTSISTSFSLCIFSYFKQNFRLKLLHLHEINLKVFSLDVEQTSSQLAFLKFQELLVSISATVHSSLSVAIVQPGMVTHQSTLGRDWCITHTRIIPRMWLVHTLITGILLRAT